MNHSLARLSLATALAIPTASCDSASQNPPRLCAPTGNFAPLRDVSTSVSKAVNGTIKTFATQFSAQNTSLITGRFKLSPPAGNYSLGVLTMVRHGNVVAECHEAKSGNIECQGGTISDNTQPNTTADVTLENYERINISPQQLFHEEYDVPTTPYPYATMTLDTQNCEATFRGKQGLSCGDGEEVCASTFTSIQDKVRQLHEQFAKRVQQ